MLGNIKQRDAMEEINPPITRYEIKKSTKKLDNDKAPGLNGVLPNTFKALSDENFTCLLLFNKKFWRS